MPVSNPIGAITGGLDQLTGVSTIGQTLTNITTAPATLEYTVTPTSGSCVGVPFTITVTVNPTPTTLGLTNQTYCNAVQTSEIVLTNDVSGTTYAWTNSNTAIGLADSGTGNIPVFTPTNNGTAPITATISIIATANGCSGPPTTLIIKVKPNPIATQLTNVAVCPTNSIGGFNFTSTPVGATYTWTNTSNTKNTTNTKNTKNNKK